MHVPAAVSLYFMARRINFDTAEKVSMVLLTRSAFGTDAGLRHALLSGLDATLITRILERNSGHIRKDAPSMNVPYDRRSRKRESDL